MTKNVANWLCLSFSSYTYLSCVIGKIDGILKQLSGEKNGEIGEQNLPLDRELK